MVKNKQEEAIKTLEALVQIPLHDVEEMAKHAKNQDWKKLRQTVKRIQKRKAKYGF